MGWGRCTNPGRGERLGLVSVGMGEVGRESGQLYEGKEREGKERQGTGKAPRQGELNKGCTSSQC